MDINSIDDIQELKALIYDQLVIENTARNNIAILNERLTQLTSSDDDKVDVPKDATKD